MIPMHACRWPRMALLVFLVFMIGACASSGKRPVIKADDPADAYIAEGTRLLEAGHYEGAEREFLWVLRSDAKNSRAHTGLALTKAYQGNFKESLESLRRGCKYAVREEEKKLCQISRLRIYTVDRRDKRWFLETKEAFAAATRIDPHAGDAYYFMGLAYKENLMFDDAGKMFRQAAESRERHAQEAGRELERMREIQKVMVTTRIGRRIVLAERITRADCAALIMEEIKLGKILQGGGHANTANRKTRPEGEGKSGDGGLSAARDISGHPLSRYIEDVSAYRIAGLDNYPDGTFRPGEYVNRGAYAMMMADLIVMLRGKKGEAADDSAAATNILPQDVAPESPYYDAIMTVTSREIMGFKDENRGVFAPLTPVSGLEALTVIRKFKEDLRI